MSSRISIALANLVRLFEFNYGRDKSGIFKVRRVSYASIPMRALT